MAVLWYYNNTMNTGCIPLVDRPCTVSTQAVYRRYPGRMQVVCRLHTVRILWEHRPYTVRVPPVYR